MIERPRLSPGPFSLQGRLSARLGGSFLTYFCTRQFSVSATKISSRGDTAI
jgi:hypothetical protein